MTKEEIIQAITDDKMMPFIQPEQLAEIVDFVIKNYKPYLPSNLDEAAEKYAGRFRSEIDQTYAKGTFKAGAEWMAGQGEDGLVLFAYASGKAYIKTTYHGNGGDQVIVLVRKK